MEILATIAMFADGVWTFQRMMRDEEGNVSTVEISRAEYDAAMSDGDYIECENC